MQFFGADAFTMQQPSVQKYATGRTPALQMSCEESSSEVTSRRALLSRGMGAVAFSMAGVVLGGTPDKAEASYSAYTNREKDWEARKKNGDIEYKTARDLRQELREIAPMNSESSKVFCPNGPSSAVSPLMENKCGDRMAAVSVYGRSNDIAGNSIPGFSGGTDRFPGAVPGGTGALSAQAGGFPAYTGTSKR